MRAFTIAMEAVIRRRKGDHANKEKGYVTNEAHDHDLMTHQNQGHLHWAPTPLNPKKEASLNPKPSPSPRSPKPGTLGPDKLEQEQRGWNRGFRVWGLGFRV